MLLTPNNYTNDRTYAHMFADNNTHNPESAGTKTRKRGEGMMGQKEGKLDNWMDIELDGYG